MKKKLVVVISIGMILICGSVFAITAVVNSNYEKESIETVSYTHLNLLVRFFYKK